MAEKIVYLMRGLPSCGKSHMAKRLAGKDGVICETDAYFLTEVGNDPASYDYDARLLGAAQDWNYARFRRVVDDGATPVIVDRGNSLSRESQRYARYAAEHGYRAVLREPDSPWWQEIRVLLKYKSFTRPILLEWALYLEALSRATHRVPAETIRRIMKSWRHDLTIEDLLDFEPAGASARRRRPGGIVTIERHWGGVFETLEPSGPGGDAAS